MKTNRVLPLGMVAIGIAVFLTASAVRLSGQQTTGALRIDQDDIGGVVTSANDPEVGAWVVAETTDLPTKFAKIVVTDDQGRYVLPDLPRANYNIWVRGYGMVDSPKVRTTPGKIVNLKAVVAPNDAAAAEYYPAIYWYSMLKIPEKSEFPIGKATNQSEWLNVVKTNGCITCHQLGNKATRTIPRELGEFKSSAEAWQRRILSGQAMNSMLNVSNRIDAHRANALYGDWTDRVAAGELPKSKPSRPQGVERNIVITLWDWSRPAAYLHDEISTDKRSPTVNANGPIYGATELSTDFVPIWTRCAIGRLKLSIRCAIRRPPLRRQPRYRRLLIGEPNPYGTASPTSTIRCSMKSRGCGLPRGSERRKIRRFARKSRTIRRPRSFRSKGPTGTFRCMIRKLRSSP